MSIKPQSINLRDTTFALALEVVANAPRDGSMEVIVRPIEKKRSYEQNKLQRMWVKELSEQGDMTPEQYRGLCKLTFGVPILRLENDEFREQYDRTIKPLPYEVKLDIMMEPMDFPVTRLMSVKQKSDYLDQIFRHWSQEGFHLTRPERG
jgi:hypothetical protein